MTFDDVLLVPNRTHVRTRRAVDTSTVLAPDICLSVPIISANTPWCTEATMAQAMARMGGLGVIHRMQPAEQQAAQVAEVKRLAPDRERDPAAATDSSGRLLVGAAVGVKDGYLERARGLVQAGADALVVDVAHGHSDAVIDAVQTMARTLSETPIIAGNVATAAGVRDLADAGAQVIKIGIGPGGVCTTRSVTGCGVPQVTAVASCAEAANEAGVCIVADGGMRSSGDMVKALAAGASAVMLGTLLAGVDESAAQLVQVGDEKYKISTGFATLGMELTLKRLAGDGVTVDELGEYVPEGVDVTFPYAGPLKRVLTQYIGGMRSGFSYCGAASLAELWAKATFVRVTPASVSEGKPHAIDLAPQIQPDYAKILVDD